MHRAQYPTPPLRPLRTLSLVVALLLVTAPLLAYTVILKDGSQMQAKEKPRVEGERVIITLPNGTETFLAAEEVDFEATEEYNEMNLGGAVLIEGGKAKGLPTEIEKEEATLGDLISSGQAKTRARAPVKRPDMTDPAGPGHSKAGYLDLRSMRRQAFGDLELMSEVRSYFTSQGLEAQVFRGSQPDRALIEVITSSESAVFKSLEVAARALPQVRERHPNRLEALEMILRTERGSSGGQFVMTADLASDINDGSTDIPTFFIENVQF